MADSVAKKTYSADASAVLKALQDMERGYARMQAQIEKLVGASKQGQKEELQGRRELDAAVLKSLQDMERRYARMQVQIEKLAGASKRGQKEELQGWRELDAAVDEAIRKTEQLKRSRGELIRSTNFVFSSRDGGGMIPLPPSPNFTRTTRDGGAMIVRPPTGLIVPRPPYVPFDVVPPPPEDPLNRNAKKAARGELIIPPGPNWTYYQPPEKSGFRKALESLDTQIDRAFLGAMDKMGRGIAGAVKEVGGLAAGFFGLSSIIASVNDQVQRSLALQRESLAAHQNLARGQAEIVLNTFGMSAVEREAKFLGPAREIAAKTGLSETEIARTIGRQAGRGAGLSHGDIVAAVDMAAQLARHTPEQLEPTAGGIQQLMKVGGLDPTHAAALFQSAAAAAYPGDPTLQARMLQQALSSGLSHVPGATAQSAEQILELTSWLSSASGEERGEGTRTATAALLQQLAEFRSGEGAYKRELGGFAFRRPQAGMPTDPLAAIEWLRSNPSKRRAFLEKMSFERQFEGPIRNLLLDPDSRESKLFAETQRIVSQNVPALDEQLRSIEAGTPQLKLSSEQARQQVAAEQAKARLTREGVIASIRGSRDEATKLAHRYTGYDWKLSQWMQEGIGYATDTQPRRYLNEMRAIQQRMINRNAWSGMSGDDRQLYDKLDAMIKTGERQLQELKTLSSAALGAGPAINAQRGVHSER